MGYDSDEAQVAIAPCAPCVCTDSSPKANNELVGPQQTKEVVDEEVLQMLVPDRGVVAAGVVGTVSI